MPMQMDKHPRSMALIAVAVGIFAIGVILTIAFWDEDALLGVGITMAVVGIGIVLLGCINLQAQRGAEGGGLRGQVDERKNAPVVPGPAPGRVPPRQEFTLRDGTYIDGEPEEGDDEGGLIYDEFSASPSPTRAIRLADGTVIGNDHDDGDDFSPASQQRGATSGGGAGRSASVAGIVPSGTTFVSITPVGNDAAAKRAAATRRDGGPLFPLSPFDQRSFPVPANVKPEAGSYADAPTPVRPGSHGGGFNGIGSPGGMGSDAENTPPAHGRNVAGGSSSRPLDISNSPGAARLPANTNAPYTTTTTTTVTGSGMRHRATAASGTRPMPLQQHGDSPLPPRREIPTGYDAGAHGFTPEQMDAEIAKHRDERYEAHLAAVDQLNETFRTPQGDDDALPADYWTRRQPSGPARTVKFD